MQGKILFLVKFFVIFLVLDFFIAASDLGVVQNGIAEFEAGILGLESEGARVSFDGQEFFISQSCTGLVSAAVLVAVVFAFRRPNLKTKIISVIAGTIILLLINLFRVYFVLVVGISYGPFAAEAVHVISWLGMAGIILALWFILVKRLMKIKNLEGLF